MQIDLSYYVKPPELIRRGRLTIIPLAPISMVSQQPGSYFRSEMAPTKEMLYGLVENAAGWHFHDDLRKEIIKGLSKVAKKRLGKNDRWKDHPWLKGKLSTSGSGYASLLQYHLDFGATESDSTPLSWDDLWSMLNRSDNISFVGGSRNYDFRLENLITLSRSEDKSQPKNSKTHKHPPSVSFGDKEGYKTFTLDELREIDRGNINVKSLSSSFPQFYSSPRRRGYIEPSISWVFDVYCTSEVAKIISESMEQPASPLYLGTNDGWVHVKWESYD